VKRGPTLLLRLTILGLGALIFVLCVLAIPVALRSDKAGEYAPILLGLSIPAVPFFYALVQSMKILNLVDKNQAFSEETIEAFGRIKYCGLIISGMFTLAMPYIYIAADHDDAPGVIVIGMVIVAASLVVASFAQVLQKLVQHATSIKSENDLTV
jgi:hypothetical protein